jgi:deazaflavin-dependent oxidoreductase (nitroreductase family)
MNAGPPTTARVPRVLRVANRFTARAIRKDKGPSFLRLLTIAGRRTGQPRTTPVVPVYHDSSVWLVSPYGEVDWVRNLRAAAVATITRGTDHATFSARELAPTDAVDVLRAYLSMPSERFVRKEFDITKHSSDEAIAAEAPRHPVFVLTPLSDSDHR